MFLDPKNWSGWSVCAGKTALEEGEPGEGDEFELGEFDTLAHEWAAKALRGRPVPDDIAAEVDVYAKAVTARIQTLKDAGAVHVELIISPRLDIGLITGERGAVTMGDAVILADFKDWAAAEVWAVEFGRQSDPGPLTILALAAFLKYQLLHEIREVRLFLVTPAVQEKPFEWTKTPDELYIFGQEVTERAALALALVGESPRIENLTSGPQCAECRAAYRCPALAAEKNSEEPL